MTELRVWVLVRCVQAIQEQEAAGGEDNKDFNVSRLTSVSHSHYFKPTAAVNH